MCKNAKYFIHPYIAFGVYNKKLHCTVYLHICLNFISSIVYVFLIGNKFRPIMQAEHSTDAELHGNSEEQVEVHNSEDSIQGELHRVDNRSLQGDALIVENLKHLARVHT